MKNDLISRQAAIDALNKKRIETMGKGKDVNPIWECLDVVAQVPSAQPEQRWISCSERLPEKEDVYLVTFDKKCLLENEADVSDAHWIDSKWQYAMIEHYEHKMPKLIVEPIGELKIVAWMPLPEPWKEEE